MGDIKLIVILTILLIAVMSAALIINLGGLLLPAEFFIRRLKSPRPRRRLNGPTGLITDII